VGRPLLFLFLVVGVPAGVYWAGNGFSVARFPAELTALRGGRPERPTAPPPPEPVEEEPPGPRPPPKQPPAPPPAETPAARAERLFREGKFQEAAAASDGLDERTRSLALLGQAFAEAFPPRAPKGPYVVVRTRAGDTYEGFAEEEGGRVRIVDAAGRSFAFPESAFVERRDLSPEEARSRIAAQTAEGLAPDTKGPRVFALIQAACAAGRPDAAVPLLARALQLDQKEPYFLSTVRARVPPERQKDMYRAFATAQAPALMAEEGAGAPRELGGRRNDTPPEVAGARDPRVRALMEQAAPYRRKGEKLYKQIVLEGADATTLALVNDAIANFDKALALYEQAVLIEESDALYAVMQSASRLNFNLRFWRQQLEGR
jgi:hypothetical protein